jgi:hypothetical protein
MKRSRQRSGEPSSYEDGHSSLVLATNAFTGEVKSRYRKHVFKAAAENAGAEIYENTTGSQHRSFEARRPLRLSRLQRRIQNLASSSMSTLP